LETVFIGEKIKYRPKFWKSTVISTVKKKCATDMANTNLDHATVFASNEFRLLGSNFRHWPFGTERL
jgi:hypothetical protein